jgi:hypothetical protein
MKALSLAAIMALAGCGEKHGHSAEPAAQGDADATAKVAGAQATPLYASFHGKPTSLPYVRVSKGFDTLNGKLVGLDGQLAVSISDDPQDAGCGREALPSGHYDARGVRLRLPAKSGKFAFPAGSGSNGCRGTFQMVTIDPDAVGPVVAADTWDAAGKIELTVDADAKTVKGTVLLSGPGSTVSGNFDAPLCDADFDHTEQRDLPCPVAN